MKKIKIYKRVMSGTLALVAMGSAISFNGCTAKKAKESDSSISISIDKTEYEKDSDKSSYLSGFHDLKQENKEEKKYEYVLKHGDKDIKLLYINKDKTYTSEMKKQFTEENTKAMSEGFFRRYMKFVMPDCYKNLVNKFNTNLCEFTIRIKEFNSNGIIGSDRYLLYETEIFFKKDPSIIPKFELQDGVYTSKAIYKGDSLCCKYLFIQKYDLEKGHYLEPIAFEQTGMGSYSKNIQDYKDELLKDQTEEYTLIPLDETNIIEDSTTFDSERELNKYLKEYKRKQ